MKAIGVIPARHASVRFPAKVLASLNGRPLIQHVWENARQAKQLDDLLIACDHPDVLKAAQSFGAKAVMTDANHPSGSDRICEAVRNLAFDIIVNIQGDEPFVSPAVIDDLCGALQKDTRLNMATVIKGITDQEEFENPNVVKCTIDHEGYALYFSRSPIPYDRNDRSPVGMKRYKHFGLYAYRKDFLLQYTGWPKSMLESTEQLEQLRVLERGHRIKTIITQHESIAVDTPADLERAEQWLKQSR
jgi:3-deoxy-manno-octulosonate cytidylyltransferase (CMP-KDO synthetase)